MRWEPDSRGRLQKAALELYGENGFDRTTVTEIAVRAGVTERTFFRYFADKREVIFYGQEDFQEMFVSVMKHAPDDASPIQTVTAALHFVADQFEPRRSRSQERQRVISANPSLRERELIKFADVARAIASILHDRGVSEPAASLTAEIGMTVFRVAFQLWIATENTLRLSQIISESLEVLTWTSPPIIRTNV